MKKAFTLIELLVVLAIMGLLVSLVAPSGKKMYRSFSKKITKIEKVGEANDKRFIAFLTDNKYEQKESNSSE